MDENRPNIMSVLRMRQNKTQNQMAKVIEMSQARYSQIESRVDENPPEALLRLIADNLGWLGEPKALLDEWVGTDTLFEYIGKPQGVAVEAA